MDVRPACPLLPLLLPLLLLAPDALAAQLPEEFKRCKKNEPKFNDCLQEAGLDAVERMAPGIPALGLQPFDPLHLEYIEVGQGNGPVSIGQKFRNITVTGLSKPKIFTTTSDLKKFQITFVGNVSAVFEADYEMDGRILVLPVTGKGRCRLVFTNLNAATGPRGHGINKKGKMHWDVSEFYLDIMSVENMEMHYDNLFNGDKILGQTMNSLMNENWKDVWRDLEPVFEQTFNSVFQQFSKRIFDKVPFDDIFPD